MEVVKTTAAEISKSAANLPVWIVVPRRRIGRGTCEHARDHPGMNATAQVAPIDCVQTARPGQVEPSESGDPTSRGIVVSKGEMISAVENLLQRRLCLGRRRIDRAPVVSQEIPVGAANACEIGSKDDTQVSAVGL